MDAREYTSRTRFDVTIRSWRSGCVVPTSIEPPGARFVTRLADEYLRSRATRVVRIMEHARAARFLSLADATPLPRRYP